MWSYCVLVFICINQIVSGLEIVGSPPDLLWVNESESIQFGCTSNQPWQWCYWELTPVEGLADQPAKTRKFQTHQVRFLQVHLYTNAQRTTSDPPASSSIM